ncbi:RpiB/LacA/LacB family sugar-phosphate isomerase [Marivivens aquimaris]|uniref:RpiB/LacA/LacB family sugar-phosphate isomerase n=1 Tax=Marivivens aquimaris TaxID=2774876 RepID=UPI00187E12D4|nr:RpiB/LacA/LacB family sugar-phosphate isomerase [Marivivens aquimaris]
MKLAVAGDSAGAGLAKVLADYLSDKHEVTFLDMAEVNAEFYANLSDTVASGVAGGTYEKAILVCGTGIGVCIAANKVPGIRAALTHDTYSAGKAATSNNAQIITMGARVIGAEVAKTIVDEFLSKSFDEAGASASNVQAINDVDAKYNK